MSRTSLYYKRTQAHQDNKVCQDETLVSTAHRMVAFLSLEPVLKQVMSTSLTSIGKLTLHACAPQMVKISKLGNKEIISCAFEVFLPLL